MYGNIPNVFDYFADPVVHRLLLKSFKAWRFLPGPGGVKWGLIGSPPDSKFAKFMEAGIAKFGCTALRSEKFFLTIDSS